MSEISGSLITISKIAAPCSVVVETDNIPSVALLELSANAPGIKLGTPWTRPRPVNITAIIVRLVILRPISFFMLLEFL